MEEHLKALRIASLLVTLALLPSLGLALILKDQGGPLAFVIPVTILSLTAAILQPWADASLDAALLLMLQGSIVVRILLQNRRPRGRLPAGLLLR